MSAALVSFLLVLAGGAIGGVLRYLVSLHIAVRFGSAVVGTLAVNVTGAALIGLAAALLFPISEGAIQNAWLFLVVGILGSYTTVSTFSLQTLELMRTGRMGAALANVAGSVVLCIGAAAVAYLVMRAFFP